jgi:hypothetical protein
MIYKVAAARPGYVRILFELPPCIWADHVAVVGDFNQWRATATPMQQDRDGVWQAAIELPHHTRSEFRYLVDGRWMTDYHADGCVSRVFGTDNSVVVATLDPARLAIERKCSQVSNGVDKARLRPWQRTLV